jgi:hypothetical protein
VPRRPLRGARLLDEQVIVEEANPLTLHQLAGDGGCGGLTEEPLVLGNHLPVAEVLDEPAGILGPAGDDRPRARRGEVPLDAALDERDLVRRERATHTDGAVTPEVVPAGQRASSVRSQEPSSGRWN